MSVAYRTVTTLLWRIVITEIPRQSTAKATRRGEQRQHGVNSGDLCFLVTSEISVELGTQ
jgi:hypothetical protein